MQLRSIFADVWTTTILAQSNVVRPMFGLGLSAFRLLTLGRIVRSPQRGSNGLEFLWMLTEVGYGVKEWTSEAIGAVQIEYARAAAMWNVSRNRTDAAPAVPIVRGQRWRPTSCS